MSKRLPTYSVISNMLMAEGAFDRFFDKFLVNTAREYLNRAEAKRMLNG